MSTAGSMPPATCHLPLMSMKNGDCLPLVLTFHQPLRLLLRLRLCYDEDIIFDSDGERFHVSFIGCATHPCEHGNCITGNERLLAIQLCLGETRIGSLPSSKERKQHVGREGR